MRVYSLKSRAVHIGKQDLSAGFSVPPTPPAEEEDSRPVPRTPQRCSDSGGNPPRKTQLNKQNQRRTKKNKKSEEESKNMRAAKTDKFGFHQNPSSSEIGVSDLLHLEETLRGRDNDVSAASEPQKKQDNRSKRPARLGRDKYQSSPGSPFLSARVTAE